MATLHVGGLSSGNDYQSMIDQLMDARRVGITTKETKQEEIDYDLGAWSQVQTVATDLNDSLDTLRSYELWRDMTVTSSYESVATATSSISAVEASYTVSVSQLAQAQSVTSDQLDTSTDLITAGYVAEGDVFDIQGQSVTIAAGETLNSLRDKINSAAQNMSDADKVQASIIDSRLVLTRSETGSTSMTLSDTTGTALEGLGVLTGGALKNEVAVGKDAQFTVNGSSVVRSSNTGLDDVIEGMTLDLEGLGNTTISVGPNREAVKDAIMDFVDKYNAFAQLLDDYGRIEMGGSDNLAQKGELYGDSLISTLKQNIRKYATDSKGPELNATNAGYTYEGSEGIMDTLGDIGIWTTGRTNELEVVDEEKLDYMLDHEFENVTQLFKGSYDSEQVAYTNGVASDFYAYTSRVSESMTGDIAKRIDSLTDKYDALADDIDEMNDDLHNYEQDLWDNFTRMEDALANMKSQTAYISAVFSSKNS